MTVASESVLFNTLYPKLEEHIHPLKLLEELEKAHAEYVGGDGWNWDQQNLAAAFVWVNTPQGGVFWSDLDSKCYGR